MVDIWYDPPSNDIPGWRGPAQTSNINVEHGIVIARFQGRTLDRRRQEARVHIPYLLSVNGALSDRVPIWQKVKMHVEGLTRYRGPLGIIYTQFGRKRFERTSGLGMKHPGDARAFATQALHLENVAIVVTARGVQQPAPSKQHQHAALSAWMRGSTLEEAVNMSFDASKLKYPIHRQGPATRIEDVDLAKAFWTEACFLEFLGAGDNFTR